MELVNRETNFNKVFNTAPNVGVMNPLQQKVGEILLYVNSLGGDRGSFFFQKFTGPGPVSTRNLLVLKNFLLVLNIGMKEIKFVGHKINLLVTHILFKMTILGWQFNT